MIMEPLIKVIGHKKSSHESEALLIKFDKSLSQLPPLGGNKEISRADGCLNSSDGSRLGDR